MDTTEKRLSSSLEHAEHNEAACDFIQQSGQYNDWVVTTAFYAALHYAQDSLFPREERGNTYRNFSQWYKERNRSKAISKHYATLQLVKEHDRTAGIYYRYLFDMCWTSRYRTFKISASKAEAARDYLRFLKRALLQEQG